MTEERKEELKKLLEEAIACLELRDHQGNKTPWEIDVYKKLLLKRWTSYSLNSLQVIAYEPCIINKKTKSQLLDLIKKDLEPFIHEDKILSACYFISGSMNDRYPLDKFLEQLLRITIVYGIERAVDEYEKCTENSKGSFQVMAFLQGIKLEKEIQVSEGIRLVPLPNSPSKLPYNVLDLSNPVHGMPKDLYINKTLLIVDCSISPIFQKPDPNAFRSLLQGDTGPFRVKVGGENSQNFNIDDFYKYFCQALSIACNSSVQIALRWRFLKEDTLFNFSNSGFGGQSYVHHSFQDRFPQVGQAQIDKAKCLYNNLVNQNSNFTKKLQIPIDRWIKSKTSGDSEDKIIDVAIALESIYLSNISEPTELSFRLRLHASWFLEKDIAHRKELMKDFSKIYKWRSKVVHTGIIPNKKKKTPYTQQEIADFITKAQDLCRDSIMKIIEDGKFTDWNNLILGEVTQ